MITSLTIMGLGNMRIMAAISIRNIQIHRVDGARFHQSANARYRPSVIAHALLPLLVDSREASHHCRQGLFRRQRDRDELRHRLFQRHRRLLLHAELLRDASLVLQALPLVHLELRQSSRSQADLRPRYRAKGLVKIRLSHRRREQDTSEVFRGRQVPKAYLGWKVRKRALEKSFLH
ncbi:hypothetical protein C8J56DRAFT_931589 [Mycena floridula]|nr:hypothetical protein C8J56DRAFT_931589 [Mycena floridula]